jgi:hypothetical protein
MKTSSSSPSLAWTCCFGFAAASFFHLAAAAGTAGTVPHEHQEFEATLDAPYHGDGRADARTFTISFDYPGLQGRRSVHWRLELVAPDGRAVAALAGAGAARRPSGRRAGALAGAIGANAAAAPGVYRVRLHAAAGQEEVEQSWDIAVGSVPAPALPAFAPLPGPRALSCRRRRRPARCPTRSITATCTARQPQRRRRRPRRLQGRPGSADRALRPGRRLPYARAHGLDILMASEHNHMFDGSDGTNSGADPAAAKALYQAGLQTARGFNASTRTSWPLYGMEWGVISNGGHLNIFNSDELLGWEKNGKGELLADTATPRNDYGALYTLMRQRGWIGQFNHPSLKDQFKVNGVPLAYTPDGDEAMALCEVMNSTAFSTNDKEPKPGAATSRRPATSCWKRATTWPSAATRTTTAPTGAPPTPTAPRC